MKKKIKLMLDSGAYSVWNRGEAPICCDEYADYLLANEDFIDIAINMDEMPGSPDRKPTPQILEQAAGVSFDNWRYLTEDRGVTVMPVYHLGEDFQWLRRIMAASPERVALSFSGQMRTAPSTIRWLDRCFEYLTSENGYPTVPIHGLGVNTMAILFRYPWTTVDATTWVIMAGYGQLLVPPQLNGSPDYTRPPIRVMITDQGRSSPVARRIHLDHLGDLWKSHVFEFMEQEGFTLDDLRDSNGLRAQFNARILKRYSDLYHPRPFEHQRQCLFEQERFSNGPECASDHIEVYFASSDSGVLNKEKVRNRLISYYELRGRYCGEHLDYFVKTGTFARRKRVRLK